MFYSLYQRNLEEAALAPSSGGSAFPIIYEANRPLPEINPARLELKVSGLVEQPMTISLADLKRMPQENRSRRVVSADGWTYRGNWGGVAFRTLCNITRPRNDARYLRQINILGQEESVEISVFLHGNALITTSLDNQALTPLQGGPVRLLPFNVYLHKGLPHLCELIFSSKPGEHRSGKLGYPESGAIKPSQYYAFDQGQVRPIHHGGEVTEY